MGITAVIGQAFCVSSVLLDDTFVMNGLKSKNKLQLEIFIEMNATCQLIFDTSIFFHIEIFLMYLLR